MSAPRFEIVRTDAPQQWHARFVAANGKVVWTTENYARRNGALKAIGSLAQALNAWLAEDWVRLGAPSHIRREIRDVDERTPASDLPPLDWNVE